MTITLDHYTPLHIASQAIRQCWQSQGKSDTDFSPWVDQGSGLQYPVVCGPADRELIDRIGNKFKHASTLEHLNYNFTIDGVSRALLQELARHRMASPSVKSTRYTLKELKNEAYLYNTSPAGVEYHWELVEKYCVMTGVKEVDEASAEALSKLQSLLIDGVANDKAKYCLPESYKTSLAWTVNARSLQNFLSLRSSKAALWEIRDLANAIFEALPEDHKYLFEGSISL